MKKLKRYSMPLFLLVFCLSCNQRIKLGVSEYADWMSRYSKQLMVTAKAGEWFCSLAYLPAEWMALQETGGVEMKNEEIKKLVESYHLLQHYVLKISVEDTSVAMDKTLNDYFAFGMQKDVFLIENKDTLPCTLFHFENTFSLTGEHTFNLGFENNNSTGDKTLFIRSAEKKFNSIELNIDGSALSNVPLLKLEDDAI